MKEELKFGLIEHLYYFFNSLIVSISYIQLAL